VLLPEPLRTRQEFRCVVKTTTPVLGGGYASRCGDEIEFVRAQEVRGLLRYWWRAVEGWRYRDVSQLRRAENRIWGGVGNDTRSDVDVRLTAMSRPAVDKRKMDQSLPGSYALWPAREPPSPRWSPGLEVELEVVIGIRGSCSGLRSAEIGEQVLRAIRAWLIFGGYGSRTRRGAGSLTVSGAPEDVSRWLPAACKSAVAQGLKRELERLLGECCSGSEAVLRQTPSLRGATLWVAEAQPDAQGAWLKALEVIREFRGLGWGEARRLRQGARHEQAAWPRAALGLPLEIGGRTLVWYDDEQSPHGRLASPLITKAIALADGRYVPALLWLARAHPPGTVGPKGCEAAKAPFDRLYAPDEPLGLGDEIAGAHDMREFFFCWLARRDAGANGQKPRFQRALP
jgi:CRISPR-associated protein Cmr1